MAGPGKPGPPARGIERFQYEENMNLAVELYVGGSTYGAIADAVGWSGRSVAKRAIDRAIKERGVEVRQRAWSRGDALVEKTRESALDNLNRPDVGAADITAAAAISANYDRHYGLSPDMYVEVAHSDDAKTSHVVGLVERMQRIMTGMDALNLDGVGSGRSPEEQIAALEAAGDVIGAEEVADDEDHEDRPPEEESGRWHRGRWIPSEDEGDALGPSGDSALTRTSNGWPLAGSAT